MVSAFGYHGVRASGYRSVRARPSGRFDAEIRFGEERIRLGTFDTAHKAARPYDAVAWRLGRSRRQMNFHGVWTREQAEQLAPPSPPVTREQQWRNRELEQRLRIAEQDERLRLEWARQFSEDVAAIKAFYTQKEEQKAAAKKKKNADREKRRAVLAARKAERAKKAARRADEKKNGAGPSTISPSSSSSFEWTTTPVSDTNPSSHSSDFDWDSE